MLQELKAKANCTLTENGAVTLQTTGSDCLDLFATIGALRSASDGEIISRFIRAYAENQTLAMKLLFYGRDIRGGLGERRVFRILLRYLSCTAPGSVRRNLQLVSEYGRWDDLLVLLGTPCEKDMIALVRAQFEADLAALEDDAPVSLLGKWLPSVNTSNRDAVRMGKRLARAFGLTDAAYRKALVRLRGKIRILENNLREQDYSFDYAVQPAKALLKYRHAFLTHDAERYQAYLQDVVSGKRKMHTGTLYPYELIQPFFSGDLAAAENDSQALDAAWNALDLGEPEENALCVIDGSGSMYSGGSPLPITVALSLGMYFAERCTGEFHNHFITFSEHPRLVEIKGADLAEKVRYCASFNECANTNIQKVFELILDTAVRHGLSQEQLPQTLYFISDMEFDSCTVDARSTNFAYAEELFARHGYRLPRVVFWNVQSRHEQQPVQMNKRGVVLVSGFTPKLFTMIARGCESPYAFMESVLLSDRYAPVCA